MDAAEDRRCMKQVGVVLMVTLAGLVASCSLRSQPFDEGKWRHDVESQRTDDLYAPHFRSGEFFNPWMPMEHGGFWRFLKWKLSGGVPYTEEEKAFKPGFVPNLKSRILALDRQDFIAWAGHSTFLMRLQGEFWITDPVFSQRAFLIKRTTPSAITPGELKDLTPQLNVIISHNHYDHLDGESIRSLPEGSRIIVPLGLKEYVQSMHRGKVHEMDWWETLEVGNGAKIICLPAQHWSRRLGQATNSTLWASFLLVTPETSIYYGGDSGYFIGYREFGKRFPGIDYALLSTTAYHPRWFMHYAHTNIQEALDAFQELGARYFVPTQWGTFKLGDNPSGYPILDLKRVIEERNLDPNRFLIMDIGQLEVIPKSPHRPKHP